MIIYGVALLAICTLTGLFVGDLLGVALGVKANVGGVGFAMLLLLYGTQKLKAQGKFPPLSARGVEFWTAMYIPVVVAMASQQNVLGAMKGGPAAIIAGITAVILSYALIPVIGRIGKSRHVPVNLVTTSDR